VIRPSAEWLGYLDALLFAPYYGAGVLFLAVLLQRMRLCTPVNLFTSSLCYASLALFGGLSYLNLVLPYYPDTELFSKIISENHFPDYQSRGVIAYWSLSYPLRLLAGFRVVPYLLLQILLYMCALLLIWRAWLVWREARAATPPLPSAFALFLLMGTFYPAALLFIPIPLREYLFVFGFAVLVYGFALRSAGRPHLAVLAAAALVLIAVRPQMLLAFPVAYFVQGRLRPGKVMMVAVLGAAVWFLFPMLVGFELRAENIGAIRNALVMQFTYTGAVYGPVQWQSFTDILIDLPLLLAQFILAPLPIMHTNSPFSMLAALIDCLFVIVVCALAVPRPSKAGFFVAFFAALATLFAIWEFFIGDAVRHRIPLILLLLPIAATRLAQGLETAGQILGPRPNSLPQR
jgi:hypothetical protein